jgi:hypothetical protein
MPSKKRRVAAYLPKPVDAAFQKYVVDSGLSTSQATNQILSEYFGPDPETAQPINPGWLSAQVQHANRIIPRLAGKPQFQSVVAELAHRQAQALAVLAAIEPDDGEDF